ERFRTFAELAADWFWETDAELKLTFLSDGFARFGRQRSDELLGQPLRDILATRDSDFDWKAVEESLCRRAEFEVELPYVIDARTTRTIYLRGLPFGSAAQTFSGYRGIGRDVTREREALQQITHLAMHDPLTNALNRRSLEASLQTALLEATRRGELHAF